jgi:hypothetical protein
MQKLRAFRARGWFEHKFADQMRDPAMRVTAANIHNPFAKNRSIDQRGAPKQIANMPMRVCQFS